MAVAPRFLIMAPQPIIPTFSRADLTNVSLLGSGSYGKVYAATYQGRKVVLKEPVDRRPTENVASLFRKEAQLLHSVRGHDNVVGLVAFDPSKLSFLMQFCSLSFEKLSIEQPAVHSMKDLMITLDDLADITSLQHMVNVLVSDVAAGLRFLHSRNIVHHDIKPDNILVTNQHYMACDDLETCLWVATKPLVAVLTDFGESRSDILQTSNACATSTVNLFRGSPAFMAPENVNNSDRARSTISDLKAADVWSFGMVVFCAINPSLSSPYMTELNARSRGGDAVVFLAALHAKKCLPAQDAKYLEKRNGPWAALASLYRSCAKYTPSDRPTMEAAQRQLVVDSVNIQNLALSQSTASDEWTHAVVAG